MHVAIRRARAHEFFDCTGSSVRKGLSSGRTSSKASSAGMVSCSAASRVSTCPATLARTVRVSSRVHLRQRCLRLREPEGRA